MYKFSHSRRGASRASFRALTAVALLVSTLAPSAFAGDDAPAKTAPAATAAPTKAATPAPTKATAAPTKAAPNKAAPTATPPVDTTKDAAAPETTEGAEADAEAAPAAPTDEEREEAKLSFEAGTKAFGEGDFDTAVAEFKKASAKVPSPHAEYWIARAMDSADADNKNAADVVAAYNTFLTNPGAQHAGPERVTESQARVVELKKLLPAQIKLVTVPEGASVTIDGEAHSGKTPVEVALPAGAHKFEIALDGYDSTVVEMDVQGGSAVEQEVTLSKEAPPPEPVAEAPVVVAPPAKRSMVPAAVTLGLGGAGLISGTLFGIMALGAKKDFKDDPTSENADTAERNALIADMSFGIALTLGITGVVLLTADDEEAAADTARKQRLLVAPYASKKGGGIAGMFRF